MPSSSPRPASDSFDGLRQHLSPLYRLAELLTGSSTESVTLVKETYRRALQLPHEERNRPETRALLYRLLLDSFRDQSGLDVEEPVALQALHRRLARDYIDRSLPLAYLSLSDRQQLLLLLTAVERLSPPDAGKILGSDPAVIRQELQMAQTQLYELMLAKAGPAAREVLRQHYSEKDLRESLRRLFSSQSSSVPSSLRSAVEQLAAENIPQREPPSQRSTLQEEENRQFASLRKYGKYTVMALLAALVVGLGALLFRIAFDGPSPEARGESLVVLTAQQATDVRPSISTTQPTEIQRFLGDELGRSVTVPDIAEATLTGASTKEVVSGMEIPVLFFTDRQTDAPLTVFVYSYALLDRFSNRVYLEQDVLEQLEDEEYVDVRERDDETVLTWRRRASIYVAVTPAEAGTLPNRIEPS